MRWQAFALARTARRLEWLQREYCMKLSIRRGPCIISGGGTNEICRLRARKRGVAKMNAEMASASKLFIFKFESFLRCHYCHLLCMREAGVGLDEYDWRRDGREQIQMSTRAKAGDKEGFLRKNGSSFVWKSYIRTIPTETFATCPIPFPRHHVPLPSPSLCCPPLFFPPFLSSPTAPLLPACLLILLSLILPPPTLPPPPPPRRPPFLFFSPPPPTADDDAQRRGRGAARAGGLRHRAWGWLGGLTLKSSDPGLSREEKQICVLQRA